MELKKLIFSNIANCLSHLSRIEESIRVDETVYSSLIDQIILKFDFKFEKSYGRLIKNYTRLGEIDRANKCKETVNKEIL